MKYNDEHGASEAMLAATAEPNAHEVSVTSKTEANFPLEARPYAADVIAVELIANGYRPVPIPRGEKGPEIRKWNEKAFGPDDFSPSSNIGVLTGHGVALLDIDVTDKEIAGDIVREVIDRIGARGPILIRTGLAPKVGIPIRAPIGIRKQVVELDGGHKIEVLGLGQQFVAYGLHPDGQMYDWADRGSLVDHRAEGLPDMTEEEIKELLDWATENYATPRASRDGAARFRALDAGLRRATLDRKIIDLLNSRRNTLPTGSYIDWRNMGFGTRAKYRGTELEVEAREAFIEFSLRWENGATERRAIDKLWNSERESDGGEKRIGPGTAIKILQRLPTMFVADAAYQTEKAVKLAPPAEIGAQFTGLAKGLYQQLTLASDRQASNIQIAGVLTTLSAIIGPCAVIQNGVKGKCCTNLYTLALAKTGAGKETIRTLVSSALNVANRGSEVFDGAPSDVSFNAALSRLGGRSALLIDEAGIIAKASKQSSNSHQRLLIALLMKAHGCGLTRLEARQYSDRKKDIEAVEHPRPTVMLTSTVQDFADGSSQEDSASGFFNRFLAFVDEEHIPYKPREVRPDNQAVVDLPEDICSALRRLAGANLGPVLPLRVPPVAVKLTDDAYLQLEDFKFDEVEAHLKVGGVRAETWSRAVENAQRVAGLLAVSDALMDDGSDLSAVECNANHVDLALKIVRRGLAQLERIAHMAGQRTSRIEALKDKVLRTLEKNQGQASRTQINRTALRGVRNDERTDILDALVGDGEIVRYDRPSDGKSGPKAEMFALPNNAHNKGEDPPVG